MTNPFPKSRTPSKNILKIPKQRTPSTNNVTSPVEGFLLYIYIYIYIYIDNNIIQNLVDCANIEGARERSAQWKETDFIEMKAFLGCLIHTGTLHQHDISVELLFSSVDGNSLVRSAFSVKHFSNLLNHLRLATSQLVLFAVPEMSLLPFETFGTHSTEALPSSMCLKRT